MAISALVAQTSTALQISEVEQNPDGDDTGNEWVELYSETTINLDGYYLTNKANKHYNLSGEFSGYLTVTINTTSSGWITNKNDSIALWKDEEIDKTAWLEEEKEKKGFAWSKCSSEWVFIVSTKGEENACEQDDGDDQDDETDNNESDDSSSNDEGNSTSTDSSEEDQNQDENIDDLVVTSSAHQETDSAALSSKSNSGTHNSKKAKIVLNEVSGSAKYEKPIISREGIVQQTVIYAFAGFCVLLIILLSLRKV